MNDIPTVNRQNNFLPKGPNRTSQIVTTIIPAGQTFPIFQAGQEYYLIVATGQLYIKPNNGSENAYVQGTGLVVDDLNLFASLQIRNPNTYSVVLQIFVGFGGYIDNRLIVYDPNVLQVVYPTYPVNNTANEVLIPDRSGTPILDINGNAFLALNRVGIYVSNLDIGLVYNLQALITAPNPAAVALAVQPLTNIVFPVNADLRIKIPAGNINAIVSEIYNAIRPA